MVSNDQLWIPLQSLAQYNVGYVRIVFVESNRFTIFVIFFLSSVSDVPLHSFKKLMCSLSGIGDLLSELSLSHTNGEIVVCHIIDFSSYTRCFVVIQETRQ